MPATVCPMPLNEVAYANVQDKKGWGEGPWQHEPDKVQWVDPTTGYACLIVRGPVGALCGYVGVPKGHPAYGLSYDGSTQEDHDAYRAALRKHIRAERGKPTEEWVPFLPESTVAEPYGRLILGFEVHGGLTFSGECDEPTPSICHMAHGEDKVWWLGFDCSHAWDVSPKLNMYRDEVGLLTDHSHDVYRDLAYVKGEVTKLAAQLKGLESCELLSLPPPS